VSAATLVKAATFGSPLGVRTTVRVGFAAQHRARLIAVDKDIDANEKREADLQTAVADHHGDEDAHAAQVPAARVVVDRNVHAGTEIHIDNRCWTSHDDHAHGVFRLREGEIVFGAS
jgi:uncharacterized protein (DUF342 family)